MSGVSIEALVKTFGSATAVDRLDLIIAPGEFVTLLGPSGCGKTTTLRCLAGLEVPTTGEITIGDRLVFSGGRSVFVPPDKRDTGMVFQSYALWPHMTVGGNVGYPLKLAKVGRAEARRQVVAMLERVHLADRVDQPAVSLSGGQQQRVALARAMINRPGLLLFDEPLSNLDAKLRQSMRALIRELHDELGTTSVYVTHDQEEAIALADRVVVMDAGRIEQVGTPQQVYSRPESQFVADFMGFQNILPATVTRTGPDGLAVELAGTGATLRLAGGWPWPAGSRVAVAFRARHVQLHPGTAGAGAALAGRVRRTTYLGSAMRVLVAVNEVLVRTQLDESEFGRFGPDDLSPGQEVSLTIGADHIVPLPADSGQSGPEETAAPPVATATAARSSA
ncbi:MAG: ABC transporter ATP-binding protein [Natronosporangium sp.]